jgi:menaquinone-specific isochorismate synthase
MEDSINKAVNSFTGFLTANKSIFKESKAANPVVSFAHKVEEIELDGKIDYLTKYYEKSFYFEKPDEDFSFIGVDEIISITEYGDKRFAATDKRIKELKNNFINNWDTISLRNKPLFVGGMKFNVEHQDDDWKDFGDSIWFIPELLLLKSKNDFFIFYNFIHNAALSEENIIEKFRSKLENIIKPPEENNPGSIKIHKLTGNSPKDKKKWKNLVNSCLENIYNNKIDKIVVSRRIEMLLSGELNLDFVIKHFKEKYKECYLFIFHIGKSSFFGATPERLVKFYNGTLQIEALAGSASRGKTKEEDLIFEKNLLNSDKDINEHDFVVKHIKDSISSYVEELTIDKKHSIKKLNNIQHISTSISAKMNSENTPFNIVKELFPTPAVCGIPKEVSLNLIKKLENYYRGLYSGIIGWFNFNDEGEFAVAIRSALTYSNKLIAFAGCGIVDKSDPDLEYEETELKLKPILSIFNENQ